MKTKIILALGNPDAMYRGTRHNVGKDMLNAYCARIPDSLPAWTPNKTLKAEITETSHGALRVIYAQSATYMNESGIAASRLLKKYAAQPAALLVIHDDSDLGVGTVKFTKSSGSAGHHGIESIMQTIGTQKFARIRIGIRPKDVKEKAEAFVLKRMNAHERDLFATSVLERVSGFIESWLAL